jgi:hypothetical protein
MAYTSSLNPAQQMESQQQLQQQMYTQQQQKQAAAPFIASPAFCGPQKGYVYQQGQQGIGYYAQQGFQQQGFQQQMQNYQPAQQQQYGQIQKNMGWTPPPVTQQATMIQVMVPGGFPEGSSFPSQYAGKIFSVQVPPGINKGQMVQVQVPPDLVTPQIVNLGGQNIDVQQVIAQFAAMDTSGNGKLSADEMRIAQATIMGAQFNEYAFMQRFGQMDSNGDGEIDLREYLVGYGMERGTANVIMTQWREQRKMCKEHLASERTRQKAEREKLKMEAQLEREKQKREDAEDDLDDERRRARNRDRGWGGGGYGYGGGCMFNSRGYNSYSGGYNNNNCNRGYNNNNNNNNDAAVLAAANENQAVAEGALAEGGGGGGGEVDEYGEGGDEGGDEVDMYGAAPQDLPDGDDDDSRVAPVQKGARRAPQKPKRGHKKSSKPLTMSWILPEVRRELTRRLERNLHFPIPEATTKTLFQKATEFSLQWQPHQSTSITLCTQCSVDRIPRLQALVEHWEGPVVCAVHVPSGCNVSTDIVAPLTELYATLALNANRLLLVLRSEAMVSTEADLWAASLYPINALRNVSVEHAPTNRVFLCDVDFACNVGAHASLVQHANRLSPRLKKTAIVVPAFEAHDLKLLESLPSDVEAAKDTLFSKHSEGAVSLFHVGHFPKGHRATNLSKWFDSRESSVYEVPYEQCFEPYVVVDKTTDDFQLYDERFRGYGMNKIQHIQHLEHSGFRFYVATDTFIISPEMEKSSDYKRTFGALKDPMQSMRVQALFNRFKGEMQVSQEVKAKASRSKLPLQPHAEGKSDEYVVVDLGEQGEMFKKSTTLGPAPPPPPKKTK